MNNEERKMCFNLKIQDISKLSCIWDNKNFNDDKFKSKLYKISQNCSESDLVLTKLTVLTLYITSTPMSIFEIMEYVNCSAQKLTKICKELIINDILIRSEINGVAYYKLSNDCYETIKPILMEANNLKDVINLLPEYKKYDIDVFINEIENGNDNDYKINNENINKIKNDKSNLIDYLKNIVSLYGNIYSLKKRFKNIEEKRSKSYDYSLYSEVISIYDKKNDDILDLQEKIKKLKEYISTAPIKKKIDSEEIASSIAIYKPSVLELKKSNIFNKKKIELENEQLEKEYKKKLELYEDKLKEKEQEYTLKNEKEYEEELKVYNIECDKKKEEIEKLEKSLAKINDSTKKEIENCDEYEKIKSIEYEEKYIKENIEKNIKALNELYSYNIVYGKYHDHIIISSFIDYLESGRCETLDGTNGAYNLYEQESRTDIIINKMDIIINQLEIIKNNQYYIYNELKIINNNLELIEDELLVNNFLEVVEITKLDKIINNTNEIAYNTEVSSYYAKMNNEYLKALTFIKLING